MMTIILLLAKINMNLFYLFGLCHIRLGIMALILQTFKEPKYKLFKFMILIKIGFCHR